MAVFTVHQPPVGPRAGAPDPVRFTFVRDGFYVWGFLFSVLWLLRHRLWIAALLFASLAVLLDIGLRLAGFGGTMRFLAFVALAFLVGLEGATLRRWTLTRRGWTPAGVVIADDEDEAERRYFREAGFDRAPAQPAPTPVPSRMAPTRAEDVIGSFPQPERKP